MTFKSKLVKTLLVAVSLSIVGVAAIASVKRATIYTETNQVITVSKKSPEFTIKLSSNPTTGYVWKLKDNNQTLVVNTSHHFTPGNTKLIGSGGFDEWSFRASPAAFADAHETKLVFVYARPWEKYEEGKRVEFRVRVK